MMSIALKLPWTNQMHVCTTSSSTCSMSCHQTLTLQGCDAQTRKRPGEYRWHTLVGDCVQGSFQSLCIVYVHCIYAIRTKKTAIPKPVHDMTCVYGICSSSCSMEYWARTGIKIAYLK